jgi:hypothetical protein
MRVPSQFENPLCSEVDTELFFPEKGANDQAFNAKKICKSPHIRVFYGHYTTKIWHLGRE